MIEIRKYHLFPTDLIPNSPRPLLFYRNALTRKPDTSHYDPTDVWDLFTKNRWKVSWIFRYGPTQHSHYHSQAHECMAVLSGTATIRFGVADTSDDLVQSTYKSSFEKGGIEVDAEAGDVFIIPAGVAHKTFNTKPEEEFKLLTPGKARGIEADDPKKALADIKLSGFTMMGAYNGGEWDFVKSGGDYEKVWSVPKPELDPVFGKSKEGLCAEWRGGGIAPRTDIVDL